jgi:catechol 2,3-dioxygenase-like lactoylglutathione lyase family enzyme
MPTELDTNVQLRSNKEIAIHVGDLDRAEAFYGKVLGFRLVRRTPDQLEFDTGELRLYVNRDNSSPISYIPSFDVDDYREARRFLEKAGCTLRFAGEQPVPYFEDPFGFVFDIIERPASRFPPVPQLHAH